MVKKSVKTLIIVLVLLLFANVAVYAWPVDYKYYSQYHRNGTFSAYITGYTSAEEICSYIYVKTQLYKESNDNLLATDTSQNQTSIYSGQAWAQGSCIGSKYGRGTHRWTVDNISYFKYTSCYP